MCKGNPQWTKSLPMILLGLRTALREDFNSTAAELVYGENLRLPSDFIQKNTNSSQSELIAQLKDTFNKIQPAPPTRHTKDNIFVFKDLKTCSHALVRTDALRTSLQLPYEGPYQVLERNDKYFTLLIKGKSSNISINRLKPCFSENTEDNPDDTKSMTKPVSQPALVHKETEPQTRHKKVTFCEQPPDSIPAPQRSITTRLGRHSRCPSRYGP